MKYGYEIIISYNHLFILGSCDEETQFKCVSGDRQCIPLAFKLDGDIDCSDGSDEYEEGKSLPSIPNSTSENIIIGIPNGEQDKTPPRTGSSPPRPPTYQAPSTHHKENEGNSS